MHQKVLLATLMRFVSKGLGWNVSRDHLSSAYMQICEKLSLPSVEDLDEVYDLLASQAMIGFVDNGRRISFALDYDIARDAINDDAMIAEIADVSI
jgi:hypothetical protein